MTRALIRRSSLRKDASSQPRVAFSAALASPLLVLVLLTLALAVRAQQPSLDSPTAPSDPSLIQLESDPPGVTIGRVIQLERELAAASASPPDLPPPPTSTSNSSGSSTTSNSSSSSTSNSSGSSITSNSSSNSSQSSGSNVDLSIRVDWGRQVSKEQRRSEIQRAKEEGRCTDNGGLFNAWPWEGGFSDGFLAWEPQPDKYILMDCQRNQVSNRIRCIRNYLIMAGVLNRTLVAPFRPSDVNRGYDRRVFFDLNHTRRCYGPRTVITLDELLAERRAVLNGRGSSSSSSNDASIGGTADSGNNSSTGGNGSTSDGSSGNSSSSSSSTSADIIVTQVVCPYDTCYDQPGWGLPTVFPTLEGVTFEALTFTDANLPRDHSINITDIRRLGDLIFSSSDLIPLGDLGSSLFDESFHMEIDVPFFRRPGCPNKLAVQPHPAVFEAASRFVSDVLLKDVTQTREKSSSAENSISSQNEGHRYMAIHWRRKDLITSFQDSGAHLSTNRTARCIAARMAISGNLSTVFLATDAEAAEVEELTKAVLSHVPKLRLMQLPPNLEEQAWAQVLLPYQFEHPGLVRATLDKAVCALADVFLGTVASSFTDDIQRIRTGLRLAACEDKVLCEDEL
ncbi:hypothetical protein CLOM_g19232 [Closterium sp. NIES-68]|nr:hypothetical protein CLOM_g19232 [Closterium sp. NIES-68]